MAENTYLLGTGINQSIHGPDGLVPPLARDFFRQALRHPRIAADYTIIRLRPLLDFIQRYWHLSRQDLATGEFDLEECFTFLELQRRDAVVSNNEGELGRVAQMEWLLIQVLLDFMSECEHWFLTSVEFRAFATRILSERAAVLTSNYDMLLEPAIELALPTRVAEMARLFGNDPGEDTVTEDQIGYSPLEWNPYTAYGVPFDEVALRIPGNLRIVDGQRYFGHARNQPTTPRFLKRHGSLDWFVRSGHRIDGTKVEGNTDSRVGRSVLRRGSQRIGHPQFDYADGEILLPLIITPVFEQAVRSARHLPSTVGAGAIGTQ